MPTETVQPRTDLNLDAFRARLAEERKLAEATIAGTLAADNTDGELPTGSNDRERADVDTSDPSGGATDLFLREEDEALVGNARAILRQIERAEAKLAEGTYGISDRSGKPIPVERLEAIPYATATGDEQEFQELT